MVRQKRHGPHVSQRRPRFGIRHDALCHWSDLRALVCEYQAHGFYEGLLLVEVDEQQSSRLKNPPGCCVSVTCTGVSGVSTLHTPPTTIYLLPVRGGNASTTSTGLSFNRRCASLISFTEYRCGLRFAASGGNADKQRSL